MEAQRGWKEQIQRVHGGEVLSEDILEYEGVTPKHEKKRKKRGKLKQVAAVGLTLTYVGSYKRS